MSKKRKMKKIITRKFLNVRDVQLVKRGTYFKQKNVDVYMFSNY